VKDFNAARNGIAIWLVTKVQDARINIERL
jgi:hypothetical protein